MPTTLIASNPTEGRWPPNSNSYLSVAELFCDTIQGEGITAGYPATFLRLKGCTLNCVWCDTAAVWREGNPYTFDELFELFDSVNLTERLRADQQHLIITGGSPLKQQHRVVLFIEAFYRRYGFYPYTEVENEAVLMPTPELVQLVSQWNNSPKLSNSGMKERVRYKPEVLHHTAKLPNSWFKFVVADATDWNEIQRDFLDTGLCSKKQIILMPCGESQVQLYASRQIAADMAIEHQVRFSDRLHVTIWDKKTGV